MAIPPRRPQRAFTLIEAMIVIALMALLSAIALPSFSDSIRQSRRSEAFAALSMVQQAQEHWRGQHGTYASSAQLTKAWNDASDPGLGLSAMTPSGNYGIAIPSAGASTYTVTATAVAGTAQAADTPCAKLGVRMDVGHITYAGGAGALVYATTHPCWKK